MATQANQATITTFNRRIKHDERVLIVGKTGSGKTYFAKHFLHSATRLIVFDPKGRINRADWKLQDFDSAISEIRSGKPSRGYVPPQLDENDWELYFWEIYGAGNCLVYIDELYGVGPAKGSRGLQALYTRGRELGIGVWGATQRPVNIPTYAASEAEWVIMFQLILKQDKERMYERIGPKAFYQLRNHQFIVYNDAMDEPRVYNRLVIR